MPYAPAELEKPVTIHKLRQMKADGEKFTSVALYDAPTAGAAQRAGVETVLIGDSLGMAMLGYDSTVPVTMEEMIHHIGAVARGNRKSLIMGDLPFMTYATPEQALTNAARIMQAGAHMVKIEGGTWLAETVKMLSERGIPVCAHLGLTPQSVHKFGGYRIQGRSDEQAGQILDDAAVLDEAGADLLVLECVPSRLAKRITDTVSMPTIGIGAGSDTDGQVLVITDLLGLTEKPPKFSKNFLRETGDIHGALRQYAEEVKNGQFPTAEHSFS